MWKGSTYYLFIRWAHSNGSSSGWTTRFGMPNHPRRKSSSGHAVNSGPQGSRPTDLGSGRLRRITVAENTQTVVKKGLGSLPIAGFGSGSAAVLASPDQEQASDRTPKSVFFCRRYT